jgi:hypothetical protein
MDNGPTIIDSSYASHGDYRGHTGIYITLGKGAIQAISTKQPINTKSSAESELVAASDGATPAINVLNIITRQGIQVKSLTIEQENKNTLAMISNGRATGLTSRHINIRFFWLNDRLASGEIFMRYIPTADMTADLLTKKHMEGSSFYKHRNTMLNKINAYVQLPGVLKYNKFYSYPITQNINLCVKNMCVQSTCRLEDILNSALVYA